MYISSAYKFLDHLKTIKNSSPHTIRNYAVDLNEFKAFLEIDLGLYRLPEEEIPKKIIYNIPYKDRITDNDNKISLQKIDRNCIRRFLAYLYNKEAHKRTIVRRLASLRSFFKFAVLEGLTDLNPTETLQAPKLEKTLPSPLTIEEVKRLLDQPDTTNYLGFRDRTIMEILYSSGLRVGELVALNKSNFSRTDKTLKLLGKGNKERLVPLTEEAFLWLTSYLDHDERHKTIDGHSKEIDKEAIFLNKFGKRLTGRSIDRSFNHYIKQCGLANKATPHIIRHTIACLWLKNGMNLKTIQALLGHSSLATTTIYTKVDPTLKKAVYDQTHPRA